MSRSTRTLLIVLSVALNIAFVTVWALHRLPLGCRHHAARGRARGMESVCPFHERIQATPAQRQEIESRLEAFRNASMPLCMEVNKHRLELIDLLAAPEPDRAAITAKQQQIADGQNQMQERVIANLLEMKAALTPEQQKTLFDTIRARSDCAGHGPMAMGMGTNPPCR
jgi:Spy/CpxP family protein refolding chaperone